MNESACWRRTHHHGEEEGIRNKGSSCHLWRHVPVAATRTVECETLDRTRSLLHTAKSVTQLLQYAQHSTADRRYKVQKGNQPIESNKQIRSVVLSTCNCRVVPLRILTLCMRTRAPSHTYRHAHTHTYLPTYLPTYIHTYIHAFSHSNRQTDALSFA